MTIITAITISFFITTLAKVLGLFSVPSNLNCGLLGYSGAAPYDPLKIKILFLYNESRGIDSCGIYDGKHIWRAVDKSSSAIVNEDIIKPSNILIGHTRKSTFVNSIVLKNAHPFKLEHLIGAHNGTISNHRTLAHNRDIDIASWDIDTHAFYLSMNDDLSKRNLVDEKTTIKTVLEEYEGSAALLFTLRDGCLYCYRDKDKPLYRGSIRQGNEVGLYISSLKEGLQAIGCVKIKEFKENLLYILKDGKLVGSQEIDRMKTKPTYKWVKTDYKSQDYPQRYPERRATRTWPKEDENLNCAYTSDPAKFVKNDLIVPNKIVTDSSNYLADILKAKVLKIDPVTKTMDITVMQIEEYSHAINLFEVIRCVRTELFDLYVDPKDVKESSCGIPEIQLNLTAPKDDTPGYQTKREIDFSNVPFVEEEPKSEISSVNYEKFSHQVLAVLTGLRENIKTLEIAQGASEFELKEVREKLEEEIFLIASINDI